jgi:broad specificity phosphatase PhoE
MRPCPPWLAAGLFAALLASVTGGATAGGKDAGSATITTTTFLLVRHAEKATDDPRDPALTPAGLQRAERLARLLADRPLTAVYTTDYRRTRQTAQPTAASHGLDVTIYDAGQPPNEFAQTLRQRHAGETILVVGHSNTVPGILSQLCECMGHPLEDDDYGDLFEIRSGSVAHPVLRRDTF